MNDTDDDDTHAAPESNEPKTDLHPTVNAPEVAQAWSLDDTDELEPARHGRIVVWAGLVALLAGIVAAVILLGATFFGWLPSKHAEPPAVPTSTATKPVAAPPPAPTTSDGSIPTSEAATTVQDEQYLKQLRDNGVPVTLPNNAVNVAQAVCIDMSNGVAKTQWIQNLSQRQLTWVQNGHLTPELSDTVVNSAIAVYCPQFSGPAPTVTVTATPTAAPAPTATTPTPDSLTDQDHEFLRMIKDVWVVTDPAGAVTFGHNVCTTLAGPSHPTTYQVAQKIVTDSGNATSLETAETMVSAAIVAYCPQYR
jgi:hypothetical protein